MKRATVNIVEKFSLSSFPRGFRLSLMKYTRLLLLLMANRCYNGFAFCMQGGSEVVEQSRGARIFKFVLTLVAIWLKVETLSGQATFSHLQRHEGNNATVRNRIPPFVTYYWAFIHEYS